MAMEKKKQKNHNNIVMMFIFMAVIFALIIVALSRNYQESEGNLFSDVLPNLKTFVIILAVVLLVTLVLFLIILFAKTDNVDLASNEYFGVDFESMKEKK